MAMTFARVSSEQVVDIVTSDIESVVGISIGSGDATATLKALGYYPVIEGDGPIAGWKKKIRDVYSFDSQREVVVRTFVTQDLPIDEVRVRTKHQIDYDAERRRQALITEGFGQVMSYIRKADQARAVKAGETNTPIIDALVNVEVDADGNVADTRDKVADVVLAAADQWSSVEAQIDAKRRGAKIAADKATTAEDAYKARNVDWPEV